MQQIFMVMGSYLAIILLGIGIINFLSQGYLLTFLRVKMSRGKLIIVRYKDLIGRKYAAGRLEENILIFKYNGNKLRYTLTGAAIFREMGVTIVDVDVIRNIAFTDNYEVSHAWDAEKMDNLFQRCLTKPELQDKMDKLFLVLLIAVLGGLVLMWLTINGLGDQLNVIGESVRAMQAVLSKGVV